MKGAHPEDRGAAKGAHPEDRGAAKGAPGEQRPGAQDDPGEAALPDGVARAVAEPLARLVAKLDLATASLREEPSARAKEALERLGEARESAERIRAVLGQVPVTARRSEPSRAGSVERPRVVHVIDDDAAARGLVVRWLTGAKFECVEHPSGQAAIPALVADADRVDAVVLDVMMPGLDGFDVIGILKANPATAHIPIILLSAHAVGESDVARGIEAEAADYLTKPFSGPVLVAKVRAACQRSEAEREVRAKLQFAEEHATTDALTGVLNRRAFEARLPEAVAHAVTNREPLALVVLDLDHFKKINDTFGHEGGDRMLVDFAHALRRVIRVGDQAFRYGGEEFALLLRKCDAAGALRVATRIQHDLRERPVSVVEGQTAVVRFSAGIAAAELKNDFRVKELFARADAALYAAKNEGRDRIEVAD